MDSVIDFNAHLKKQLGFLVRSCQSYDEGFTDEAIRIATIIRVIIHQTSSSTSLLKHLNATTINLLSTVFPYDLPPDLIAVGSMGIMKISDEECKYFPPLGNGPFNKLIPSNNWWSQVAVSLGTQQRITRKQIVLAAANKDGGTHVDAKLTSEYAALAKDGAVGSFEYISAGSRDNRPIDGAHLVSLRQMGYELLQSPQLVALCDG